MFTIPQNIIPKVSNYSKKAGDFVRTFNLDLSKEYGSITPTKMLLNTSSATEADLDLIVGFRAYNGAIYALTEDYVYKSASTEMQEVFTKVTTSGAPSGQPTIANSDIEVFNNSLYISADTSVFKFNGSAWSTPVTTELTSARPHLLASYGSGGNSRLYITDDYNKVHSINTSDVISSSGVATLSLGLDNNWVITFIEGGLDAVWVGFLNILNGKGFVIEWDGLTENVFNRRIELQSGVMAGCILKNRPFVLDTNGRLLAYAGSSFEEVDRLNTLSQYSFDGVDSLNNTRFIHPNGMTVTDEGKILMFIENSSVSNSVWLDEVRSGVYEYDENIGLYHKYSVALTGEYGQSRAFEAGAIFAERSRDAGASNNGRVMVGTRYYTDATTTAHGIFYNDELKSQAFGSFTTPRYYTNDVQTTWNEAYASFDKLTESTDQIVVKYRTVEKNSLSVTATWLDTTTFTTTTDITDFEKGDEVIVLNGDGAGQALEIAEIEQSSGTYSVRVKSNPLSSAGSCIARFSNFKVAGTVTGTENKQFGKLVLTNANTSPWVQFKVDILLTGTEFHKLHVKNTTNIK